MLYDTTCITYGRDICMNIEHEFSMYANNHFVCCGNKNRGNFF